MKVEFTHEDIEKLVILYLKAEGDEPKVSEQELYQTKKQLRREGLLRFSDLLDLIHDVVVNNPDNE